MIVVSNASPLIILARAHQLALLRGFFGEVSIPRTVYEEVTTAGAGLPGAEEVRAAAWIVVRPDPSNPDEAAKRACAGLGLGEQAAILSLLNQRVRFDRVLLDDSLARLGFGKMQA